MVDYTQRALEAYLAKKQAEKDEFDRRKAKGSWRRPAPGARGPRPSPPRG